MCMWGCNALHRCASWVLGNVAEAGPAMMLNDCFMNLQSQGQRCAAVFKWDLRRTSGAHRSKKCFDLSPQWLLCFYSWLINRNAGSRTDVRWERLAPQ